MGAVTGPPPDEDSRLAAWRAHSFGPASEQPYRRRTSDWVRVVVGLSILTFAIWHQDDPGDVRAQPLHALNGLPDQLESFFRLLYALGALWALGLVVVAALVARRWRLARDLAIGGRRGLGRSAASSARSSSRTRASRTRSTS